MKVKKRCSRETKINLHFAIDRSYDLSVKLHSALAAYVNQAASALAREAPSYTLRHHHDADGLGCLNPFAAPS